VAETGVVDHDVEPPRRLRGVGHQARISSTWRNVDHVRLGAAAGGRDLGHRIGHRSRGAPTEHDMGAGTAEGLGDGPADTARCTGDDRGAARQGPVRCSFIG